MAVAGRSLQVKIKAPASLPRILAGLDKVARGEAIKASLSHFRPELWRGLVETSYATGQNPTGNFARGWEVEATSKSLIVRNRSRAAVYIDLPTRPHDIRPRPERGPNARLAWRKGGRGPISAFIAKGAKAASNFIFAQVVHHPGTVGKFIFKRTITAKAPSLFKTMIQKTTALLRGQ